MRALLPVLILIMSIAVAPAFAREWKDECEGGVSIDVKEAIDKVILQLAGGEITREEAERQMKALLPPECRAKPKTVVDRTRVFEEKERARASE